MRLKILSGELEVEFIEDDAFGVAEAKRRLKMLITPIEEPKGTKKKSVSGSKFMGKLNEKPKLPI